MAEDVCIVPIGEMTVSATPGDVLVAYGLGSCVAICLYDPLVRVGGMLHALLPAAVDGNRRMSSPTKFVDQGTLLLIDALLELGARRIRLMTYLCGGAHMPSAPGSGDALKIGARNVLAAEAALQAAGLRIRAQATGGHIGRTVKLHIANGRVTVKTLQGGERTLNVKRQA